MHVQQHVKTCFEGLNKHLCHNLGCLMGCDILLYSVVVPGISYSSQLGIFGYRPKLTSKHVLVMLTQDHACRRLHPISPQADMRF